MGSPHQQRISVQPLIAAAAAACFLLSPVYAADAAHVVADKCLGCHSAAGHMGGLNLEKAPYAGKHGPVIVPGKSDESRLYLMITGKIQPQMPMAGGKLEDAEIAALKTWIDQGAAPLKLPSKTETVHIQPKVPVKPQVYDLAWSPDSKVIAIAGFREVRLIDPATKQQIAALPGAPDAIRAVAFSKDGSLLAAAGGLPARSGEVQVWDVRGRKLLHTIKGHSDCMYAVAFSPDGKALATSSYDKLIKLWDIAAEKEIRTFKDHIDAVYALAFTPDGKRLVSGAADRTVKVWNVDTGERLYTLSEPQDGINTIALDPTGTYVAAAGLDKTIRIWSLGAKSGKMENSLMASEDAILRLAWSPDGKRLAASSADKTVGLYSVPDLVELKSYPEPDWVYGLQFSPDGKELAVGSFTGGAIAILNL